MFHTIDDIKAANLAAGQKWFSEGAMRWFSSIVEPKVYNGCYFITSEKYELTSHQRESKMAEMPRMWTIHIVASNGWVGTIGEFQQYSSFQEAETAVLDLLPYEEVEVSELEGGGQSVDALHQMLSELGSSPREIAATLARFDLQGIQGSATYNPITQWLRHRGVQGDITITQSNVRANGYLWQTPDPIADFIRLFDKGAL